ncbi:MAG: glycosyltransferase [Candidatus Latescibacteria bacterium]|nr:glycosyltransferase [Candidatus Latescibacterota bacterium]
MSVTIVIPSFKRPAIAARAVEAILPQLAEEDKCIVVVQGEEAERECATREITRVALKGGWNVGEEGPLVILEQPVPGRADARNMGLLKATTTYVVYVDDDSIARPGWLEALLSPLEENRADLVAGRAHEEPDTTTNAPRRVGAVLTWTGHTRRNFDADRSGTSRIVCSNNMAVRRDMALQAGGFDTRFHEPAMYEDVEFSERLRRMGARIWYSADAVVDHMVEPGGRWEQDSESSEVGRAGHMSLIFRLHRPWGWPVMAAAYLAAAKWKVVIGRLPVRTIWKVAVALLRGWRMGSGRLPPLVERTGTT